MNDFYKQVSEVNSFLKEKKMQAFDLNIVMDGQVIAKLSDKDGIHPVYAISLMGKELSERMEKANKDYWTDALKEAKEELK